MNALDNMVENQIRCCNVQDAATLSTLKRVPREHFVPEEFQTVAYSESFIPLGHGEVMLTPLIEASIIQALKIQKNEKALVVGTGSGYLTALIAQQAQHVFSVDIHAEFLAQAADRLKAQHIYNVSLEEHDGSLGLEKNAPYHLIVVSSGIPFCPEALKKQLAPQGRLFTFIGKQADYLTATLMTKRPTNGCETKTLFETRLPMLKHHYPPEAFQF